MHNSFRQAEKLRLTGILIFLTKNLDKLKIISCVKNQNESQINLIITSSFHHVKTNYYLLNYSSSSDITSWLNVSPRSPQHPIQITPKATFLPFQKVLKDRFIIALQHRHTQLCFKKARKDENFFQTPKILLLTLFSLYKISPRWVYQIWA